MNVANLQLEGLLMAIASINHLLVRKGVLSVEEIDKALRKAEASETATNGLTVCHRPVVMLSTSRSDCWNWPMSAGGGHAVFENLRRGNGIRKAAGRSFCLLANGWRMAG